MDIGDKVRLTQEISVVPGVLRIMPGATGIVEKVKPLALSTYTVRTNWPAVGQYQKQEWVQVGSAEETRVQGYGAQKVGEGTQLNVALDLGMTYTVDTAGVEQI